MHTFEFDNNRFYVYSVFPPAQVTLQLLKKEKRKQ